MAQLKGKHRRRKVKFYNLDAIISGGYRVNSQGATALSIWATESQYRNKFAAKNRNGFDISRDGLSI
ncbi:RhuM family protein [Perlabentimonas gracilis]|uniref:RhuM family protein n=1 Tax=Perlabentimonas gracilis TaxID=2715279 RepID=UPI001F352F48|nr:RhuM family protein [Perlabentimonas gracilis]